MANGRVDGGRVLRCLPGQRLVGRPAALLVLIAPHGERDGARQKLAWYRKQPIWPYGILKVVFIAVNAWALFPAEGTLLSITVITLFWLL
jgi:hypothetical protein